MQRARGATDDARGTPRFRVSGSLDGGGLGCHLPPLRRTTYTGRVEIQVDHRYISGETALACSGNPVLSFELEATGVGVMSCRELDTAAADEIAQVRRQIAAFTGR